MLPEQTQHVFIKSKTPQQVSMQKKKKGKNNQTHKEEWKANLEVRHSQQQKKKENEAWDMKGAEFRKGCSLPFLLLV